jgi:hypothetical protein
MEPAVAPLAGDEIALILFTGLTEAQERDCLSAFQVFAHRHALSGWGLTVTNQEIAPGKYQVRIHVTPPLEVGLRTTLTWDLDDEEPLFNLIAEVEKCFAVSLLEAADPSSPPFYTVKRRLSVFSRAATVVTNYLWRSGRTTWKRWSPGSARNSRYVPPYFHEISLPTKK